MKADPTATPIAEAVRAACVEAARTAGNMAMFDGLCAEGIVEAIVDAIRSVDVGAITSGQSPES